MIMLTQWLCKLRHAAYAIPWDTATTGAHEVEAAGRELIDGLVNNYCGICGGPIAPEHRPTPFTSMDAALEALAASAREQAIARRTLDNLGLTVERWP